MTALEGHKVAAARVWASARMPYLASALFAARVRTADDSGTVAIDEGWTISADPSVVESLDAVELGRLFLHLVFHALRDHANRATSMSVDAPVWWNRCADAEINDDLHGVGAVPASAPDLPADLGGEDNRLAEDYYGTAERGPRRWDCGSGADGVRRPWDQPGGSSRVDWRRVLAAEIRQAIAAVSGSVDYSYRRPSRRGDAAKPALLPTLFRPVPQVAVVCDTSGSMHDELLARALTEVEGLLTRAGLRAGQIQVLAVDTEVHAVSRVTRARDVVLAGGGGTDTGRGIEAAMRLRPKPSVIVVLTDGYTPWPHERPRGVRVIVGLLTEYADAVVGAPEWARTVVIERE